MQMKQLSGTQRMIALIDTGGLPNPKLIAGHVHTKRMTVNKMPSN